MFTPPPSPNPLVPQTECVANPSRGVQTGCCLVGDTQRSQSKLRFHRSVPWTIVLVPLALITLAAVTRFLAHPAVFDLFSTDHDHPEMRWTKLADWSLHEPHKSANRRLVKRSAAANDANTTSPVPTVPVDPVLPTPFPQPFDTTLSPNFSTTSCYDFFLNMTGVNAFLSCRPFSLLIVDSLAFEKAQNNISLMNIDVWGTCHTDTSPVQCDANMSWFASSLQESCQTDLENQVATAVQTLDALRAYELMRSTACQVDPSTNAYCYVEAVASADPSSYWFYQLPLGQPLPNVTNTACNECTGGLMSSYAAALNSTGGTTLTGLAQTYDAAAEKLNNVCGSVYAKEVQTTGSSSASCVGAGLPTLIWLVALGVMAVALC